MRRTFFALAATAAALFLGNSPSWAQYHGDAPWCAVINIGDGDVSWECYYRSVEECTPNVLAGNRGFCELNPYNVPAAAAAPANTKRHPPRKIRPHRQQ